MAGSSAVRLRLQFDYPPPSGPQCRMSWILLDLNRCRVIADLCSEIRDRFGYSSRTELDLFIEESYLPPSESIYLIRDNDSIRVKVSSPSCASSSGSVKRGNKGNKRSRDEEDGEAVIQVKKSKSEEAQVNGTSKAEEVKKKKKKKRNKKQSQAATEPTQEPLSSKAESQKSSKKASGSSVSTTDKVSKTNRKHNESSASSDSSKETSQKPKPKTKPSKAKESSSSEDEAPSKPGKPNVTVPAKKSLPITPKPTNSKPTARPIQTTTSKAKESTSSECSSSSEDDATSSKPSKPNLTLKPSKPTTSTNSKTSATKNSTQSSSDSSSPSPPAKKTAPPTAVQNGPASAVSTPAVKMNEKKPEKTDSDSSSEIELVIKTPNPQVLGMTPLWGGKARGRGGVRGGFGRARGTPWKQNYHFNYDSGEQQKQDDAQTNKSLVLENPPELKRDYSTLPLLAAPPAVGQKIAFKLLELTENYTPEVSDYKEAQIVGFNHTTNMIALELLTRAQARVEPGKFDLVYQNPDGSERVEYAVTVGSQLTERWDSLLEPRLIVENSG